jgi:hypothetical protein
MRLRTLVPILLAAMAIPHGASAQGTAGDVPLVRMRDGHGSDLLFKLNPRTLQEVRRPIRTFRGGSDLKLSPDGTRLAFARPGPRRGARIQFVDIARWRSMRTARIGRMSWLTVGWAGSDRVVAVAGEAPRQRLVWVDASSAKVVARRAYSGWTVNTLPVPGGLALVLGPSESVGPVRILMLDPDGGVRTIRVRGIDAGANYGDRRGKVLTPAVTVDPTTGRMYVVAANELVVAEVDPATGTVTHHSLGAAASKGNMHVWWRHAQWAGDGRIAVTGDHWRPAPPGGRTPLGPDPFGVRLIDTADWSIDTLDPRPDTMHVAGDVVLASGTRFFSGRRPSRSTGLLAFDRAGRPAYTRFRGELTGLLGSRGELGYVWVRRTRRTHVIDLASGRTLRTIRTGPRAPNLLSPP